MTTAKVSDLTGLALDWAVAKCLGGTEFYFDTVATYWIKIDGEDRALSKGWAQSFTPSSDWSHGGPILDQYITKVFRNVGGTWSAMILRDDPVPHEHRGTSLALTHRVQFNGAGPTPLIAAMRCYVASRLGDETYVPEELLK